MHRFKAGDKVVAVRDHSQKDFLKGQIYTILSLGCCSNCGYETVVLSEISYISIVQRCDQGCNHRVYNKVRMYGARNFAPLQNNADAIEYRLNVSIKELEVKEYQNQ